MVYFKNCNDSLVLHCVMSILDADSDEQAVTLAKTFTPLDLMHLKKKAWSHRNNSHNCQMLHAVSFHSSLSYVKIWKRQISDKRYLRSSDFNLYVDIQYQHLPQCQKEEMDSELCVPSGKQKSFRWRTQRWLTSQQWIKLFKSNTPQATQGCKINHMHKCFQD